MSIGTIILGVAWFLVALFTNPEEATLGEKSLFFISLFLFLVGFFSVFGSLLRKKLSSHKVFIREAITSFRQAIWLSSLVIICLILLHKNILAWWNSLFLVAAFVVLEFIFLSRR